MDLELADEDEDVLCANFSIFHGFFLSLCFLADTRSGRPSFICVQDAPERGCGKTRNNLIKSWRTSRRRPVIAKPR